MVGSTFAAVAGMPPGLPSSPTMAAILDSSSSLSAPAQAARAGGQRSEALQSHRAGCDHVPDADRVDGRGGEAAGPPVVVRISVGTSSSSITSGAGPDETAAVNDNGVTCTQWGAPAPNLPTEREHRGGGGTKSHGKSCN